MSIQNLTSMRGKYQVEKFEPRTTLNFEIEKQSEYFSKIFYGGHFLYPLKHIASKIRNFIFFETF